jgi:hypothetical protein
MDAKVDYLSFSIMEDMRGQDDVGVGGTAVRDLLIQRVPLFGKDFINLTQWEIGGARGHYAYSVFSPDSFAAVRWGGSANHVLVEMPGTACQICRDAGFLVGLVSSVADRCTRLDIAVDIPDGGTPEGFISYGYNERFLSHASIISAEGSTEYVGSMKSERYARVYRYNAPHPRAGILRVEHVLRSGYAKSAAEFLAKGGLAQLASMCGNTWGWRSPDWLQDTATEGKLRASRSDRHAPGRVRWIHQVVCPALVKAHKEGLIDLHSLTALMLANAAQ